MLHINNFIFAIFCIMREEKGMDITMNKLVDLKIILVLLIFAGVLTFRTDSAHADDAIRLTEEEVKREIEDYIKKEQKKKHQCSHLMNMIWRSCVNLMKCFL